MNLKIIFFDFDGVVLESADIKKNAFKKMFENECPERIDEIVDYFEEHGGVSRYIKFEYVYKNFLHTPLDSKKKEELGATFSKLCLDDIQKAPIVKGLIRFLDTNKDRFEFVIASGSPDDELKDIVRKRGLEGYFSGIFGSSKTKSEIVGQILEKKGIGREEALFVGDSMTDYTEAKKAEIRFIGRTIPKKASPFPAGTETVEDFEELMAWVDMKL